MSARVMAFAAAWDGGSGPVRRLAPAARLLCGALLCAVCVAIPVRTLSAAALPILLPLVWARLCGMSRKRCLSALAFASALFLPMLLLALPLWAESRTWPETLGVPLRIALRGTACLLVSAATSTALRLSEFGDALNALRLPTPAKSLLLQIALQTVLLTEEIRRTADAMKARGLTAAAAGIRLRVIRAWPQVWLLRLLEKAERVGAAMEVRGFGATSTPHASAADEDTLDRSPRTALAFRGVTARYRPEAPPTLSEISFSISHGERVALLGLNGSGKTTLLSAAVGLVPFTGRIEVCGIPLGPRTAQAAREQVGFLFGIPDEQLLFPNVLDDVAFSLERLNTPRPEARQRAQATLDRLGAGAHAACSPHQLSQGQRQRVALAGALAAEPPLLLLDEPSAALDRKGKEDLAARLELANTTILMATHDNGFARRVCRRFILLEGGRIAADSDDPDAVMRD